jgi:hypothetical protein
MSIGVLNSMDNKKVAKLLICLGKPPVHQVQTCV